MSATRQGPAHPTFRKLAAVMAGVCLALAAASAVVPGVIDRPFTVGVCLFVAFVMATIAGTGYWPAPKGR